MLIPKIEKNCPFCGSDELYSGIMSYDYCAVQCRDCGARGPGHRWDMYFGPEGSSHEERFSKHHHRQILKVMKERGFKTWHKKRRHVILMITDLVIPRVVLP